MVSKRFSEVLLVAPVVLVWCLLFCGLLGVALAPDSGLGQVIPSHYLMPIFYGLGIVGVWMTIVWGCLAGNRIGRWIVTPWIPIGLALATELTFDFARNDFPATLLVAGISAAAFVSIATAYRLSRWRIVWGDQAPAPVSGRLSLKALFVGITLVAACCALARLGLQDGWKDLLPWFPFLVLPTLSPLLLLAVMSRFPVRYVGFVALTQCALIALVSAWCVAHGNLGQQDKQLTFLPFFTAYVTAFSGWLLAATYLRWRGVLFQFGGVTGFAIPPGVEQKAPITPKTFWALSASSILLAAVVGGTMYHRHWVLYEWPIPRAPEQGQLHRLFRIASFNLQRPSPGRDMGIRRTEARRAIATLGPEIVPFLLQKLQPIQDDRPAENGRTHAAMWVLAELARRDALGEHTAAVIGKVTAKTQGYGYSPETLLSCIGQDAVPAIQQALESGSSSFNVHMTAAYLVSTWDTDSEVVADVLPALHRACLGGRGGPVLFSALTKAAGPDALPTLREVIRSEEQSPPARVAAACVIANPRLGSDRASLVPDIVELLNVLPEPQYSAPLIQTLGELGPLAHGATQPLLDILRKRDSGEKQAATEQDGGYGYGGYGGMRGDPRQTPLFVVATAALGKIQSREVVPELIAMLEDDTLDTPTKLVVTEALADIGPAAKSATMLLKNLSRIEPQDLQDCDLRGSACVALARIHLDRTPQLIESILRRISKLRAELGASNGWGWVHSYENRNVPVEPAQADRQLVADLVRSLAWLGRQTDPPITAAQNANSIRVRSIRHLLRPASELAVLYPAIDQVHDLLGGRTPWNQSGRSADEVASALCHALELGLQSNDQSIQYMATDIWFATIRRQVPTNAIQLLTHHLDSPDPLLRVRIAALLLAYGQPDASLTKTLETAMAESGDAVPAYIHALATQLPAAIRVSQAP